MQNIVTFLIILLMYAEFKILNSTSLRNKLCPVPQALAEAVQGAPESHCQHHRDLHKTKTSSPGAQHTSALETGTEKQHRQGSNTSIFLGRTNVLALSLLPQNLFLFLLLKRNDWIKR